MSEELLKRITVLEDRNEFLQIRLRASEENLRIEQEEVEKLKVQRNRWVNRVSQVKREAYNKGLSQGRKETE